MCSRTESLGTLASSIRSEKQTPTTHLWRAAGCARCCVGAVGFVGVFPCNDDAPPVGNICQCKHRCVAFWQLGLQDLLQLHLVPSDQFLTCARGGCTVCGRGCSLPPCFGVCAALWRIQVHAFSLVVGNAYGHRSHELLALFGQCVLMHP